MLYSLLRLDILSRLILRLPRIRGSFSIGIITAARQWLSEYVEHFRTSFGFRLPKQAGKAEKVEPNLGEKPQELPLTLTSSRVGNPKDQVILAEYPWQCYAQSPTGFKAASEPAVLRSILLDWDRKIDEGKLTYEFCSKLLSEHGDLRRILRESWEAGSFEAIRNNDVLALIVGSKEVPQAIEAPCSPVLVSGSIIPTFSIESQAYIREEAWDEVETPAINQPTRKRKKTNKPASRRTSKNLLDISGSQVNNSNFTNVGGNFWQIVVGEQERNKIPEWLSDIDHCIMHNNISKKRSKDTGIWFIKSDPFQNWMYNPNNPVLVCPGIPGVGKTVIASLVINYLRGQDKTPGPAFFYFSQHKSRQLQDFSTVLRSLCRQVHEICCSMGIPSGFDELYRFHLQRQLYKSYPSDDELLQTLRDTLQSFGIFYIVLDGLDEYRPGLDEELPSYSEPAIDDLLHAIFSCGNHIKLLATSRIHRMSPLMRELGANIMEISADSNDLARYLICRLAEPRFHFILSEELIQQIIVKVQEAARGRFLMAELHMNSLVKQISPGNLRDALNSLPDQEDKVYAQIMDFISGDDGPLKQLAKKILMWITCARHSLSLAELQHAVVQKLGKGDIADYLPSPSTIISACAGLVIVEGDQIGFVHLTAQEYFQKHQSDYFMDPDEEIMDTCLNYISLPSFAKQADGYLSGSLKLNDLHRNYPFYDYAALNWGYHAHMSGAVVMQGDKIEAILRTPSPAVKLSLLHIFHTMGWNDAPGERGIGLFLSLYHEISPLTATLLDELDEVPLTRKQGTPFLFAAELGQVDSIKFMRDRWETHNPNTLSVNIGSANTYGYTPLMAAAHRGHDPVVELLLEYGGIEINSQDHQGYSALSWAAVNKHSSVVQRLLTYPGTIAEIQTSFGTTPFILASQGEDEAASISVMQLLLANGTINVNLQNTDDLGWTALMCASARGHNSLVSLLLEHRDIDVNAANPSGWTALFYAANNGHESTVRLLLERGYARINQRIIEGFAPLTVAASLGFEAVVEVLLKHEKIDVNIQDDDGYTALMFAARAGHESIVKLLLSHADVDVNRPANNGWTPLTIATHFCQDRIVTSLLTHPLINVNLRVNGWTPLMIAARLGQENIAAALLNNASIEADSRDNNGCTALLHAAERGYEFIVKLLLARKDVNVNNLDDDNDTPLACAACNGHEFTVRALLDHPCIDVNLRDNEGRTPLCRAAHSSKTYAAVGPTSKVESEAIVIVQLLLERDDLDIGAGGKGLTALDYAVQANFAQVGALLRARGSF